MNKAYYLHIFERYLSGEASSDEIKQLRSFLESDVDLNRWMESQIMESSGTMDSHMQMKMLEKIRSQAGYSSPVILPQKKNKNLKIYLARFSAIAAVLVAVVFIVGALYNKPSRKDSFEVFANKGEKASLTLPEGSKIAINSDSKITYYNDYNNNRYIQLEGEAYFEVASNPDKPFVVQCKEVKIKVLGTSFGIKAYEDEDHISVVLNSGKVQLITPREEIEMSPNDRITYHRTRQTTTKEKVNAEDYTDWKQNRLRFENGSLETIMKTISRMHNTDIVFEDPHLKDQYFTGTIDNTNIESALDAIVLTSSVRYRVKEGIIYLYQEEAMK